MRLLALGDSYTSGEGVTEQERWPNHLARMLRSHGAEIGDPEIIARTAWTTDELSDAIDQANPQGPYALVFLLVGVNDQYRSRPVESFESFFEPLVLRAISLAGAEARRAIVVSIPDWGATPFAEGRDRELISREVEAYNKRAREIAAAAGVHWADVTEISRMMLTEPALVAIDGLHPTGEMYRRWAESLVPAAIAALRSSRSPDSREVRLGGNVAK